MLFWNSNLNLQRIALKAADEFELEAVPGDPSKLGRFVTGELKKTLLHSLPVYVPPVSGSYYTDNQFFILDLVNYSVHAASQSVLFFTG